MINSLLPDQAQHIIRIPWEIISRLAFQPLLIGGSPDQLGAERLLALRSQLHFSLELPADAFEHGCPGVELRLFLRHWQSLWPYHGWFLRPQHPLLALLALAAAEEVVVIYGRKTDRVIWNTSPQDYRRFCQAQLGGILAIAELCRLTEHQIKDQFASVQATLDAFLHVSEATTT